MKNTKIVALLLILLWMSCKSSSEDKKLISLKDISSLYVLKNVDCKEKIITEEAENINSFLFDLREKYSEKYERVILMFYTEGGEVIDFYSIGILISNDGSSEEIICFNESIKLKTEKDFNVDKLYNYLSGIEEDKILVRRKLLVIDIKIDEIKCSLYNNIKSKSATKIKDLIFYR